MKARVPVSLSVQLICDECGNLYTIEGSRSSVMFNRLIKQAKCPHCGHRRAPIEVVPDSFECKGPCGVIYKIRKHWRPVKGMCMACYMRAYRKRKRKVQ